MESYLTLRSRGSDFQEYAISSPFPSPCVVCVHVCVPRLHVEWIKQWKKKKKKKTLVRLSFPLPVSPPSLTISLWCPPARSHTCSKVTTLNPQAE